MNATIENARRAANGTEFKFELPRDDAALFSGRDTITRWLHEEGYTARNMYERTRHCVMVTTTCGVRVSTSGWGTILDI